jgi:hypothetical protein
MQEGDPKVACFREDVEGTLWFKERLVVPKKEALKMKNLDEAHTSRYSIHLGSTKMYHDLRQQFWWTRMKREAACNVSEYDTYRKVKPDYKKPGGLLQPLSILEWKCDDIRMEFNVVRFGSSWIDSPNLPTSYLFTPIMMLESMQRSHNSRVMLARSSEDNNLRSSIAVCRSLLGATTRVPQDSLNPQFGLSSTDGWPN